MLGNAVVGALRVNLGLDSAEFQQGIKETQANLSAMSARFQKLGVAMSAAFTVPLLAIAAKAVPAFQEQAKAMAQVEAVIKSMGPVAGRTAAQLDEMADKLEASSTFTGDEILTKVSANLLTFGKISGDVFDRAQQAAVDLSARLGSDLQSSAVMVGKALQDPLKGLTALSRVGVSFTAEQKAMIEQMVKVGDVAGAQATILSELERQYGGQAQAAQDATGGVDELRDSLGKFEETVGEIIAKVLPPLTNALRGLVDWLNTLDPKIVEFGVVAAGALAVMGPLALGIGGVTSAITLLTPAIATMGTALLALTGPAGAIALVTAGLVGLGAVAHNTWANINSALQAELGGPLRDQIKYLDDIRSGLVDLNNLDAEELLPTGRTVGEQRAIFAREELTARQAIARLMREADAASVAGLPSVPVIPQIEIPPVIVPQLQEIEDGLGSIGAAARDITIPAIDETMNTLQQAGDQMRDLFQGISSTLAGMSKDIVRSFFTGKDAGENFFNAVTQGLNSIADMALDMAFKNLFGSIFGGFGGGTWGQFGGFPGFAGSFGIPGLATGGRLLAEGVVEVGERGRELVRLPQGAEVIRHGDISEWGAGGGVTVGDIHIDARGAQLGVGAEIGRVLDEWSKTKLPDRIAQINRNPHRR